MGWLVILLIILGLIFTCSAIAMVVDISRYRRRDAAGFLIAIALCAIAAGFWWLTFYLWTEAFSESTLWYLKLLLIVVLIIAAILSLGGAVIAIGASFDQYGSEKRNTLLAGFGLCVLTIALTLGLVALFAGTETVAAIPGYISSLFMLAANIPWTAWLVSVLTTVILGFAVNGGIRMMVQSAWRSGSEKDDSHRWTDHRGYSYASATRDEVYDHYHGRGSYDSMVKAWSVVGKFFAILVPIVGPLTIGELTGWFAPVSSEGLVLSIVLLFISVGAAIKVRS